VAPPLQWCGGVRPFFRFATFAALVLSGAALPACFLPRSEPLPEPEGPGAPIDDEPAPPHHPPADACPPALLSEQEDGARPTSDHVLVNTTHVFWDATTELDVGDHRRAIVRAPICGGPTDTVFIASANVDELGPFAVDDEAIYLLTGAGDNPELRRILADGASSEVLTELSPLVSVTSDDRLLIDDEHVYFTVTVAQETCFHRISKVGGAREELTCVERFREMALGSDQLAWITMKGELFTMPKSGGVPALRADIDSPFTAIAADAEHVYVGWSEEGARVTRVPFAPGDPEDIFTSTYTGYVFHLAVDPIAVYFTWEGNEPPLPFHADGTGERFDRIYWLPKNATKGRVLHEGVEVAQGFAMDERHLYFGDWSGTVQQLPK
jgi:hypothetical protein